MCTFSVLGLSCETPATWCCQTWFGQTWYPNEPWILALAAALNCRGGVSHDSPRTPNVHRAPALQTHQNSMRRHPERHKKSEIGSGRFWAPHLPGPTLRGPTLRVFVLPCFVFSSCCSFFFDKEGQKTETLKLAKVGLAKVGQLTLAKVGLAKVGICRPRVASSQNQLRLSDPKHARIHHQ